MTVVRGRAHPTRRRPVAERDKGARFAKANAFSPDDGTAVGQDKARDSWLAKDVKPIQYDGRNGHRLLGETLIERARISVSGVSTPRRRIRTLTSSAEKSAEAFTATVSTSIARTTGQV